MALIDVHELTKVYRGEGVAHTALLGVTLSIEQGSFVAVMGASGSGKSTLLHILGLLDRPTSGRYFFDGHDTARLSDRQRAHFRNERIGFVFQSFNLLARTSVLDNVILPLQYSRIPAREHRRRAYEALKRVGMDDRLEHTPGQLSGGEKQRTAIARALVVRPHVVFADEPTGNLDSRTGKSVMELFDRLHKEGHTVILITHEQPAADYAQRIIMLRDGSVFSDETSRERRAAFVK